MAPARGLCERRLCAADTMQTCVLGVLLCLGLALAEYKPAEVKVYTKLPVEYGQENTLVCFASGFHPPNLKMTLKKNGQPLHDVKLTDMTFEKDWTYKQMAFGPCTMESTATYECVVEHNMLPPKTYQLQLNADL